MIRLIILDASGQRDWIDWTVDIAQVVGAIGAVLAIIFAAWTISVTKHQAIESNERLIRERRIDFELGGLKELALQSLSDHNVSNSTARFKAMTAMLGPDVVPLACAAVGLPSTPDADGQVEQTVRTVSGVPRDILREAIMSEVLTAMQERVAAKN